MSNKAGKIEKLLARDHSRGQRLADVHGLAEAPAPSSKAVPPTDQPSAPKSPKPKSARTKKKAK